MVAGVTREKRGPCLVPTAAHAGERAAPVGVVDDEKSELWYEQVCRDFVLCVPVLAD